MQAKAQEHDINVIDVYLHVEMKQDEKKTFVGHAPIELSPLLKYILEAETNSLYKSWEEEERGWVCCTGKA